MAKKKSKINVSSSNLLTAIIYAIIGILLVVLKGGSLGILMTAVGALLVVLGVVDAFKNKDMVKGVVEAVVGVAIIVCGWLIADIVLLVLGIVLIVKGVAELLKQFKKGFPTILSPIVTIVIGVLLVIAKWALLDTFCLIAGIIFIINAVLTLLGKKLR